MQEPTKIILRKKKKKNFQDPLGPDHSVLNGLYCATATLFIVLPTIIGRTILRFKKIKCNHNK